MTAINIGNGKRLIIPIPVDIRPTRLKKDMKPFLDTSSDIA